MKRRLEILLMATGVFYLLATSLTAHTDAVAVPYEQTHHPLAKGIW